MKKFLVLKSGSSHLTRSLRSKFPDLSSLSGNLGFTLIELLVVIVVIGILATLVVANFSSSRSRARDSKRKNDLNAMKTALRLYYNDFQTYPLASPVGGGQIAGCGATGTSACTWGGAFLAGSTTYMQSLVADPINASPYTYTYVQRNSGDGFTITATLENASDTDSTDSQNRCGISPVVALKYVVCED